MEAGGESGKAHGPFKFTPEPFEEPQGPHDRVPTPAGPCPPPWSPRGRSRTRSPQVSADATGGGAGSAAPLRTPPKNGSGDPPGRTMGAALAL